MTSGLPATVRAVLMRGGSSTGLFFREEDLPRPGEVRDRILQAAMGSPDPLGLQLDGMGRGTTNTSKCVVMGPPRTGDVDADYLFAQVAVDRRHVDWTRSCGSLAAAAAQFAVEEGMLVAHGAEVPVRLWQANRRHLITARVRTADNRVALRFSVGHGHDRGLLLDGTAKRRHVLPRFGAVDASLIDATNTFAVLRATDLWPSMEDSGRVSDLVVDAEALRRSLAEELKLPVDGAGPRVLLALPPHTYTDLAGRQVAGGDVDIVLRAMSAGGIHHAVPITAAIAVALAALVPGTVPAELARPAGPGSILRVGHPSGVISLRPTLVQADGHPVAAEAEVEISARRIMAGNVSLPRD